jgi:hypothetical protein
MGVEAKLGAAAKAIAKKAATTKPMLESLDIVTPGRFCLGELKRVLGAAVKVSKDNGISAARRLVRRS